MRITINAQIVVIPGRRSVGVPCVPQFLPGSRHRMSHTGRVAERPALRLAVG